MGVNEVQTNQQINTASVLNTGNQYGLIKKRLKRLWIALIILSVLVVGLFFMPFTSATEKHERYLNAHSDMSMAKDIKIINRSAGIKIIGDLDMTYGDFIDVSIYEEAKTCFIEATSSDLAATIEIKACFIVCCLVFVFSWINVLLAAMKKPIGLIVINILNLGLIILLNWYYKEFSFVPNRYYDWGIARTLYYVAFILMIVGAVWMQVIKSKEKKLLKASQTAGM